MTRQLSSLFLRTPSKARWAVALTVLLMAALVPGLSPTAQAGGASDLSISKVADPDPVMVGQTIEYTIAINNSGPDPVSGVEGLDRLPDEVQFGSASDSKGSSCSFDGTFARCAIGTLEPGTMTMTVIGTVTSFPEGGELVNFATVFPDDDPVPANNHTSISTTVVADETGPALTITKTDLTDPIPAGGEVTYRITVSNPGTAAATNVVMTDFEPTNAEVVDPLPPGCQFDDPLDGLPQVNCAIGALDPGQQVTIDLAFQVSEDLAPGTTVTNEATAEADNADLVETSETTTIQPPPQCSDEVDNDGDGQTDFPNDPDCTSPEDEEEACIPEAAFTDIDVMENKLDKMIKKQKQGDGMTKEEVKKNSKFVEDVKLGMLSEQFPDVLGATFLDLYRELENIDDEMSDARRLFGNQFHDILKDFKNARTSVRDLRIFLEGPGAPEGISTAIDIMENKLDKMIKKQKQGDGMTKEEVKKNSKFVEDVKLGMLSEQFPDVCGASFLDLYRELENIDDEMSDARRLFGNQFHDILKDFKNARTSVRDLRIFLEGPGLEQGS